MPVTDPPGRILSESVADPSGSADDLGGKEGERTATIDVDGAPSLPPPAAAEGSPFSDCPPTLTTPPTTMNPSPSLSSLCRRHGRTAATILAWYAISNAIILTTKWLFKTHFPFPLTVTTVSNTTTTLWAALVTFCCCRRESGEPPLSRRTLLRHVLPIGLCTGAEIACSNVALKLLSVSFGTILKGGGPVWTFGWGLALGLEEFSGRVATCLLMMALGIALASLGEGSEFELPGFCLQLLASCIGGLRWAMTHRLLLNEDGGDSNDGGDVRREKEKMSPLRAILYTSPTTALFVLPLALGFEGPAAAHDAKVDSTHDLALVVSTMLFVATLVFVLLLSEYWLVNATSSLALSVAGVLKELITIGGGLFFFSEHLDLLNVIGFVLCQCGILAYVKLRYKDDDEDHDAPEREETIHGSKNYMSIHDDTSNHGNTLEGGRVQSTGRLPAGEVSFDGRPLDIESEDAVLT